jgi:PLP dependent protein
VFVQVNTSDEDSKDGCEPGECKELVKFVIGSCANLKFCGLMTIGKLGDTSSRCFDLLVALRDDIITDADLGKICPSKEDFELSMGMSGDFELAVRSGATNVRIGSTIFGARTKKEPTASEAAAAASTSGSEKNQ